MFLLGKIDLLIWDTNCYCFVRFQTVIDKLEFSDIYMSLLIFILFHGLIACFVCLAVFPWNFVLTQPVVSVTKCIAPPLAPPASTATITKEGRQSYKQVSQLLLISKVNIKHLTSINRCEYVNFMCLNMHSKQLAIHRVSKFRNVVKFHEYCFCFVAQLITLFPSPLPLREASFSLCWNRTRQPASGPSPLHQIRARNSVAILSILVNQYTILV